MCKRAYHDYVEVGLRIDVPLIIQSGGYEMNDRVSVITSLVVDKLREVVNELNVTENELQEALKFLTEVGQAGEFQLLSDVLGLSVAVTKASHADEYDGNSTVPNVEGPLYRHNSPVYSSPAKLCKEDESGAILFLSGRVCSENDLTLPITGAKIDIWQANAHGLYDNQDPSQEMYNLRGLILADDMGSYEIQTVIPGPYDIAKGGPVGVLLHTLDRHDWRPAHIHFRISCKGYRTLTTMLFVPDDPWLNSDAIGAVQESLIMNLELHNDPREMNARGVERPFYTSQFDFVLKKANTPVQIQ